MHRGINCNIDGLVQEKHNSSALAMELSLSCTCRLTASQELMYEDHLLITIYKFIVSCKKLNHECTVKTTCLFSLLLQIQQINSKIKLEWVHKQSPLYSLQYSLYIHTILFFMLVLWGSVYSLSSIIHLCMNKNIYRSFDFSLGCGCFVRGLLHQAFCRNTCHKILELIVSDWDQQKLIV